MSKATAYLTPDIYMALTSYQMAKNLPSPGNAVAAILTDYFLGNDDSTPAGGVLADRIEELTQQLASARARVDRLESTKLDSVDNSDGELSATIDNLVNEFATFRQRLARLENLA